MKLKKLSDTVTISEQLTETDVMQLHALGYRAILCNRPDEECTQLAQFADIKSNAEEYGIQCRYYPIAPTGVSRQTAKQFGEILSELPKPVVAYCRSGKRSISLWALWAKSHLPDSEVKLKLQEFGMDKDSIAALVS
ncbi:beta-lactamase hydrolase domain-containing protein [Planctobacterium marinum]|uniref:Beta-lactamase hydrolase-like protein phosphatase-like domain-containing protein n=1 Tax=Planctobacterium marinum TaxID=1631968 RepID=A0AA48HIS6_9ALTE|nr:hypothetical protein MACH26_15750 [Planctobacterium marinum]